MRSKLEHLWVVPLLLLSSAAPAARPAVTDGLQLWLCPDSLPNGKDGEAVHEWPDASGHHRDARLARANPVGEAMTGPTPATALAPPTLDRRGIGNHPCLRFDADKRQGLSHYNGIGLTERPGGDPFTIVLVARHTGPVGPTRPFQLGDVEGIGLDGGDGSSAAVDLSSAPGNGGGVGVRYQDGHQLGPPAGGPHVVVVSLGRGQPYGATVVRVDGRSPPLSVEHGDRLPTLRDEGYTVGYGNGVDGAPSGFFTGVIAEVMVYDRQLSPAEVDRVGEGLAAKYHLAWEPARR